MFAAFCIILLVLNLLLSTAAIAFALRPSRDRRPEVGLRIDLAMQQAKYAHS